MGSVRLGEQDTQMAVLHDNTLLFPHIINRCLRYQLPWSLEKYLWHTLSWAFSVRAVILKRSWAFGFYVAKTWSFVPLLIKHRLCICQHLWISTSSTTRSWMFMFPCFSSLFLQRQTSPPSHTLLCPFLPLFPPVVPHTPVHSSPCYSTNKSTSNIVGPSCLITSISSSSNTV